MQNFNQRSLNQSGNPWWLLFLLIVALGGVGCGSSTIQSTAPPSPEGVEMLQSFLTQITDPDKPMPQMFGAEPAFEDAVRAQPEKVEPLRPLYQKLRAAGSDAERRRVASQMLEKL